MSKEKYFTLCEQLGREPDIDDVPPDFNDFPLDVQKAVAVFNKLGDRLVPDLGYLGKDYTNLPLHIRLENIECEDIFLETVLRLDERVIKKSQAEMKALHERAKRGGK